MGLGFGGNDNDRMDAKELTFGKFMKSGTINDNEKKSKKKKKDMENMNILIDDGMKKKKKKKKKKSKKRKLEDEDGLIVERVSKKIKIENDNMSDISSSASILSTNP